MRVKIDWGVFDVYYALHGNGYEPPLNDDKEDDNAIDTEKHALYFFAENRRRGCDAEIKTWRNKEDDCGVWYWDVPYWREDFWASDEEQELLMGFPFVETIDRVKLKFNKKALEVLMELGIHHNEKQCAEYMIERFKDGDIIELYLDDEGDWTLPGGFLWDPEKFVMDSAGFEVIG